MKTFNFFMHMPDINVFNLIFFIIFIAAQVENKERQQIIC